MTDKEALNMFSDILETGRYENGCHASIEMLEAIVKVHTTCCLISKGMPYITFDGKIYKLTDEKGE